MTNAIISPWIFYLVSLCSTLKIVIGISMFLCWIAVVCSTVYWICECNCGQNASNEERQLCKAAKKCFIPAIILTILMILIPGEKTLTQMIVTSYVTPENVNNAYQAVLDVTNDLLGIVGK